MSLEPTPTPVTDQSVASIAETLIEGTYSDYMAIWGRTYLQKVQTLSDLEAALLDTLTSAETPTALFVWQQTVQFLHHVRNWTRSLPIDVTSAELWNQYDARFAGTEATDFITYYVALPSAKFILNERSQFLRILANQLRFNYMRSMLTIQGLLDLSQLATRPDTLFDLSAEIANIRQDISELEQSQDFTKFQAESQARYTPFETSVLQSVNQHAATADHAISRRHLDKAKQELNRHFQQDQKHWGEHFKGESGEWQTAVDLSLLKFETAIQSRTALNHLYQSILVDFDSAVTSTTTQIEQTALTLASAEAPTLADIKTSIRQAKVTLIRTLRNQSMPRLQNILVDAEFSETLQTLSDNILADIDGLQKAYTIFKYRDADSLQPDSRITESELIKKGIQADGYARYKTEFAEQIHTAEKLFDATAGRLSEIEFSIEYGFASAEALLQSSASAAEKHQATSIIQDSLDRATRDLNALNTTLTQFYATSTTNLIEQITLFTTTINQFVDKGSDGREDYFKVVDNLRLSEKIWYYRRQFSQAFKRATPGAYEAVANLTDNVSNNISRVQRATGLEEVSDGDEGRLIRYLTISEEHIAALPHLYRRLFLPEPLDDPRFFAARADEIDRLGQEFERWQAGISASTAIIGERGSGVSTIVNMATLELFEGHRAIRINLDGFTIFNHAGLLDFLQSTLIDPANLPPCSTIAELAEAINSSAEPLILIVENLANLFLRTTSGFDALERFLQLIMQTQERAFWTVTCSLYSWKYFDKVFDISHFFQQEIHLDPLPREAIEKVIMRRHRVSGYKLQFTPSKKQLEARAYQQLTSPIDQHRYLQQTFFDSLTTVAGGNISVAILLWLRSYSSFNQNLLTFPADVAFDTTALRKLSSNEMFTLAAVLQHEMLSLADHVAIFHQTSDQSQLQLESMANRGLLVRKDGMYGVQPLLYRSIIDLLETSNILH